MKYCPYCSEALSKSVKICPNCKKSLDFDVMGELYEEGGTSRVSKRAKKKIWFKEHSHIIMPFITLLIGFAIGAVLLYGFAQLQFTAERSDYENQITQLQEQINKNESAAGNAQSGFKQKLQAKDKIIKILAEQQKIMSGIINFTRRLAQNSTISPNSIEQSTYFQRNFRYLKKQFETQQEKLKAAGYSPIKSYDLKTVPRLLEE